MKVYWTASLHELWARTTLSGKAQKSEKKSMASHYLAEACVSVLKPVLGPSALFCHLSWRQKDASDMRAKRVKKATPRYVAGLLAPLCCVYSDFGGIRAILSGGNPP
jgi:hypothetical protein